jgi:Ca2+-binding RTX toxin-like protein
MQGAGGRDLAIYFFNFAPVTVNLATGLARGPSAGADGLSGMEDLWGSSFGDLLVGSGRSNDLIGQPGNDSIYGAGGDDFLDGLEGTDRVDGGNGLDTCSGEFTLGCETETAADATRGAESDAEDLRFPWREGERP